MTARRFLFGLSILLLLLPIVAVAQPNLAERVLAALTGGDRAEVAMNAGSGSGGGEFAFAAAPDFDAVSSSRGDQSGSSSRQGATTSERDPSTDQFAEESPSTSSATAEATDPTDDSSTADDTSTTASDTSATSSTKKDTTTTSPSPPTTSASGSGVSGDISGKACPCLITGSARLVGEISLQGDLIVDGGTLTARSGVNLTGNGHQIVFQNGGRADIQGTKVFTWSDRGARANLTRDIVFDDLRRIMFMNGAGPSVLKYFHVRNSGTSQLGDYPLHWHLNGNSTRGTLVEGVVVVNGRHHAFVPHGSHGITFRDVIAKNTTDEALWWDLPQASCPTGTSTCNNSNDTTYDHVLVDGVTSRGGAGDGHHTISGFLMGAGSGNTVRNSVAINIKGGANCSGFHWPSQVNHNPGGTVWTYKNNYSRSSSCHGIFVWQNDGDRHHIIDGFSGDSIEHGAYSNNYEYRNINVPAVEVHAGGWSITSGTIGELLIRRPNKISPNDPTLRVVNTTIKRLIFDNHHSSLPEPPRYVFKNIGLSCADIEYESLAPGTVIAVDGKTC